MDNNHYIINKKRAADILTAVFILIELTLYLIFMWIDWTSTIDTTVYKFTSICLCLAFCIYLWIIQEKPTFINGALVVVALFFTVSSDLFTLVINKYFVLGVSLFIPAQILYTVQLCIWNKKATYMSIIIRIALVLLLVIALLIADSLDALTAVTAIYFCTLICNAIQSCFKIDNVKKLLFCIGLWLFVLCDICVGLFNIGDVFAVTLPPRFFYAVSVLMWGFYLPSQTLIVLSLKNYK